MKRVGQWSVDPGRQSLLQLKEGDREATPSRSRFRRLLFVSGGRSGTGDDEEARNRQPVYISPPFSTILVRLGLCICASWRAPMRMLSPCLSSVTVASVSTWSPLVTSGAVPAADMMRYITCTLCAVGVEPALLPWLGFWPFRGTGVPCWSIWCAGFLSRVVDFFNAAGSQLGQESGDGGRCTLEDKHDAAKKCWRSRWAAWLNSCPGSCASSPTPADPEVAHRPGASTEDLRTAVSNLTFCWVLHVTLHSWSLYDVEFVVFFIFSRVFSVKARMN